MCGGGGKQQEAFHTRIRELFGEARRIQGMVPCDHLLRLADPANDAISIWLIGERAVTAGGSVDAASAILKIPPQVPFIVPSVCLHYHWWSVSNPSGRERTSSLSQGHSLTVWALLSQNMHRVELTSTQVLLSLEPSTKQSYVSRQIS